jgi:hypothetical protein
MPGDDKRKPSSEPKENAKRDVREKNRFSDEKRSEHDRDAKKPSHDAFDDMFLRIKAKPFWPVAAATSSALRHDRFEKTTPR